LLSHPEIMNGKIRAKKRFFIVFSVINYL